MRMTEHRLKRVTKRIARRQLRWGNITEIDYHKVIQLCNNPEKFEQYYQKMSTQPNPWQGKILTGIDWVGIWEWFIENWPAILKIILTIIMFVGDKNETEQPK